MKQEFQLSLSDKEVSVLRSLLIEMKPRLFRDYEISTVEEILRQLPCNNYWVPYIITLEEFIQSIQMIKDDDMEKIWVEAPILARIKAENETKSKYVLEDWNINYRVLLESKAIRLFENDYLKNYKLKLW